MTAPQTFALAFSDDHIVRARNEHVCLTDMWKADGADSSKAPAQWLRSKQAVEFQQHLHDVGISHITRSVVPEKGSAKGGTDGGGGTWAHWHLALAYAKYLSPAFHVKCNEIVRDHMQALHATPTGPALDDAAIARIAVHAVRAMLPDLLESMRLADPDRTVIAGSTGAFEVATEAGFGEKRRNAVAGAISRSLVAWCGVSQAARALGVPRSTLRRRVDGSVPWVGSSTVPEARITPATVTVGATCPYRERETISIGQVAPGNVDPHLGQVAPGNVDPHLGQVAPGDDDARALELRDWDRRMSEVIARRREARQANRIYASYAPLAVPFEPTRPKANGSPARGSNGCQS